MRWLPGTRCQTRFAADRRTAAAASAATKATLALANHHGSVRQVAWAASMRAWRLARLATALETEKVVGNQSLAISDTRWWIDRRDCFDAVLLAPV